jgi:hypothetical protein
VIRGKEIKFNANALSTVLGSISTTPTIVDVTSYIASGTATYQRIGSSVRAHTLKISGLLISGVSNGIYDDERNSVRISVVLAVPGTGFGGGAYTLSTVLDSRSVQGVIRVLYDKIYNIVTPGRDSTGYLPGAKTLNITIPLPYDFQWYGGAAANVSTKSLMIVAVSDSASVPNPGFTSGAAVFSYCDE